MKLGRILLMGCFCLTVIGSCERNKGGGGDSSKTSTRNALAPSERNGPTTVRGEKSAESIIQEIRESVQGTESFGAVLASVRSLSDNSLYSLLRDIELTKNSSKDHSLFAEAIGELARRDPDAALQWFSPDKMTVNEVGWGNLAKELSSTHPELLEKWMLQELAAKASPDARTGCLYIGIEALKSGQGPARALQFYAKLDDKGTLRTSDVINTVFWEYAQKSPMDAERAAVELFKGYDLDFAMHEIAIGSGSTDPQLGLQYANKISETKLRNICLAGIYNEWLESDRSKALEKLSQLDGPQLAGILREGDDTNGIIKSLAKYDPDALGKMLELVVTSSSNQPIFEMAVRGLTANGPEKALALIETLPEGGMKTKMYGDYYAKIAATNPVEASKNASELPVGDPRTVAYRKIGDFVGAKGFDETIKLLQSIPDKDKEAYLGAAIPNLVSKDPMKVAELLADRTMTLENSTRNDALTKVGGRLCSTDPKAAQKWIEGLPEKDQPFGMDGYALEMVRSDIEGLSDSLASYPRNETWAAGVKVLIADLRHSDPDAAKQWQAHLVSAGFK